MIRLPFLAICATFAFFLSGCATGPQLDRSVIQTSGQNFHMYVVHQVDASTTQPKRLSEFNRGNSIVDVSKGPITAHCSGFTEWWPNEIINVSAAMDLRVFMLGQTGRNLSVLDPQGKYICGEFAEGNNPAEITIKNAVPGNYQIRVGSREYNPRAKQIGHRDANNEFYHGDMFLLYVENVSDGQPLLFDPQKMQALQAKAAAESKIAMNQAVDIEIAKLKAQERREKQEFRMALSEFASMAGQAFNEVAQERYSQAQAIQDAQQQLAYSQTQQQATLSGTKGGTRSNQQGAVQAAPANQTKTMSPQIAQTKSKQIEPVTPNKLNYQAIILEFPNADGWKRGDSSGTDNAGDLTVSIETKPVATKGKMSVITTFCNNSDTVWKGGVRVGPNPPTRSHASKQVPAGGCSTQQETFSEGASVIYVYTKRAE